MFSVFGTINPPVDKSGNPIVYFNTASGLTLFINNLFKIIGVVAGLYFLAQIISAGFLYISSNGDQKKIELASQKILQSILGFVIIASATLLTAIIGRIFGITILSPIIYGPN